MEPLRSSEWFEKPEAELTAGRFSREAQARVRLAPNNTGKPRRTQQGPTFFSLPGRCAGEGADMSKSQARNGPINNA